eukprot:gene40052-48797_t
MSAQDSPEDDVQPLREEIFDLVVVGTGLVESILACSAAKSGRKVLQLDPNDSYGGSYSSFTYSSLSTAMKSSEELVWVVESHDVAPVSWDNIGTVTHPIFHTLRQRTFKSYPDLPLDNPSIANPAYLGFHNSPARHAAFQALRQDRQFCFCMFPKLLRCAGEMTTALLSSGVSKYLEFKEVDAMFFAEERDGGADLRRLPMTKAEVFRAPASELPPADKRSLMKLLQSAGDWAQGEEASVLNERELALGRALHRPQNKGRADEAAQLSQVAAPAQPFKQLLDHFKLSERLQQRVQFGLCLDPGARAYGAQEGLRALSLHLSSLNKFSSSPLLQPLYSANELVQGFCRGGAVWGGTYMLRCPVQAVEPGERGGYRLVARDGQVFEAARLA